MWQKHSLICGGRSTLPPSTCFTGSSLVPADQRGNMLKCHILLWAQSHSSANAHYVQKPPWERKSTERGSQKCVGSRDATPSTLIVERSDLSFPAPLKLHPPPPLPPHTLFINGSIQLFTSHLRATTGWNEKGWDDTVPMLIQDRRGFSRVS